MERKIYYIDIDNTICRTENSDYENSRPIPDAIEKINKLFRHHTIIYWTARGSSSKKDWYSFTMQQLLSWGCLFNSLQMGKPSFDYIVDDKAIKISDL